MILDFLKRLFGGSGDEYNRSEKSDNNRKKKNKRQVVREYKASDRVVECTMLNEKLKQFDKVGMFYGGLSKVVRYGKAGFINLQGEMVIDLKYDEDGTSENIYGFALVKDSGKCHIINMKDEIIFENVPEDTDIFDEGIAVQKSGEEEYTVYDLNNRKINKISGITNEIFYCFGMAYIVKGKMRGFIDREANIIYESEDCDEEMFFNGVTIPNRNAEDTIILDTKGNITKLGKGWHVWDSFYDGTSYVEIDKKYGIINKDGQFIVEAQYDDVREVWNDENIEGDIMHNALIKDKKFYFFKKDGSVFAEMKFDDEYKFSTDGKNIADYCPVVPSNMYK